MVKRAERARAGLLDLHVAHYPLEIKRDAISYFKYFDDLVL